MTLIKDGTGSGDTQKVDSNKRAYVRSVQSSISEEATNKEDSYNINSGLVTLTTAGESGALYVKNNEDRDLLVSSIVTILGTSTGGSATDTTRIRIYKNTTTGTLVSTATAVDTSSNRNFGSSKTLTADTFKGAEGATITDGSVHIESLISPGNRVVFNINEIVPKGKSISVSYEPNDSNTSMKVMAAIICHVKDENE